MYNLNVSISGPSTLGVDFGLGTTTPRTPEILNSLIAMTNPLEYSFPANQQKITQCDSHSSCSGSPLESPAGSNTTPSVQQTCSQLIKAGLKLSLEMKRKFSSGDSSGAENQKMAKLDDSSDEDEEEEEVETKSTRLGLTPEDEDRRRRRRERNKIAATKCRMKKRERTLNLVQESEILENQNIDLKTQVRNLEMERRTLSEMLNSHGATCIRQEGFQPPQQCAIQISKYISDICSSATTLDTQNQQTNKQPIPPMNTIKFCSNLKTKQSPCNLSQQPPPLLPQSDHLPLPELNFCKNGIVTTDVGTLLSPGYCKPSPTDGYALSPDSGFIKSPAEVISYSNGTINHLKNGGYIPNCENSNGAESFTLKCELADCHDSPYTTVQSADRFLFDGAENYDSGMGDNRNLKILQNNNNINNNNNNNNNINNNTTVIEFTGHCQNFDSTLLKNDFLSHNSEFLALADESDTQFTDLDSGVTTYTSITASNNGCLA